MSILPRWLRGKERHAPGADTATRRRLFPPLGERPSGSSTSPTSPRMAETSPLALTRIREAIEIDPRYARAHLNLGNVLLAGGDIEGAISATLAAIGLDEQYAEAHYNLGRLYGMTGDGASAEACYLKALELRPQFPQAAVALAGHFEKSNRMPEAKSWLRRALADDPRYETATFDLCRLLVAEGKVR